MTGPGSVRNIGPAPTHAAWLIAGAGLFATAASLEWPIANTHGVTVAAIHEHTNVPGMVHALAIVSIPISLFPVYRRMSARSSTCIVAVAALTIAALLLMRQTLPAGFAALVVSTIALVRHRRQTSDGPL